MAVSQKLHKSRAQWVSILGANPFLSCDHIPVAASRIVALVEIVIATLVGARLYLVGAWLYKEEERASVVRPIAA
jgi:hypothetical protein